ncbi:MAG: hypothetical protein LBP50_07745 [Tannerella sp.]|nr:hypothetical protein [Tannerella sp.]
MLSMILSVLMCILLFDVKVTQSGDDCDYILSADDFWHHFTFPGYHGPLYPIVLSPVTAIFGINLILLKSFSSIFILLSIWLFYKSFRGKVPDVILIPALLLTSICSYLFFYAAHTYSEPLFMLIQGLFFYFFSKYFLGEENTPSRLKKDWRKYLLLAALALGMTLTRSIGYGVLGAVILFFTIQLRWKNLLGMVAAFVLVFVSFKVLKSMLWPGSGEAYAVTSLLARDAYNPALGTEDFSGLVSRFVGNSNIYLSSCLSQFLGVIDYRPSNYVAIKPLRTILLYALYALCMAVLFKRNKTLLFTGLYAGVMIFATFLLMQTSWAQDRLVVIYYPFILLFLLGGICYLFQTGKLRKGFLIYPAAVLFVGFGTLSITKKRIQWNLPVLQQNLLGDPLYGWTPDWQNFIRGTQWAAQNLEKDAVILSRKPSISRVYAGGRKFAASFQALTVPLEKLEGLSYEGRTLIMVGVSSTVPHGEPLQYIITSNNQHFTIDGTQTKGVYIYAVPNEGLDEFIRTLESEQIKYTLDYHAFLEQCKTMDNIRIYNPDMMCRHLEDSKIDYILLPQLRMNPQKKDGMFINNIHRFVWFISYKYPERFWRVHTIGNDEPCEIVKFVR